MAGLKTMYRRWTVSESESEGKLCATRHKNGTENQWRLVLLSICAGEFRWQVQQCVYKLSRKHNGFEAMEYHLDSFHHDNDPKHTVTAVKAYLNRNRIKLNTMNHGSISSESRPQHYLSVVGSSWQTGTKGSQRPKVFECPSGTLENYSWRLKE